MKKLVLLASLFFIWGNSFAQCVNDTLLLIETVCNEECVEINDTYFCVDGFYVIQVEENCDTTLYLLDLTVLPRLETVLDEVVCDGECLNYNGTDLCASGSYNFEFITSLGCDSTVTVNLTVLQNSQPVITIGNTGPLDCETTTIHLLASSSIPNSTFFWEGPGIDGTNENEQAPEVGLPGVYTVTVTTPQGCSSSESTEVLGDPDGPDVMITGNEPLSCNNLSNVIVATTAYPDVSFEWFGPGGFHSDINEIEVSESGEYILVVESGNSCSDTIIVDVIEIIEPLFVDAGPNRHIQCEFVLELDAPGAIGANVVYQWTTIGGNILAGENTLAPKINQPGFYTLTATDLSTGCTGSAEITVYSELAIIEQDVLVLDCNNPILQIDASESYDGQDAYIQWTTSNGNIVSGGSTLTPTVDAAGTYQLVIIRPGCLSFATAVVLDDTAIPSVSIESDGAVITCSSILDLTAVSNNPNVSFEWFLNGNFISEDQTIMAVEGGLYKVIVTALNGCSNVASINVTVDSEPQAIFLYGDTQLDCSLNGVGTLNVFASGPFNLYSFNWTTQDGTILSNSNFQTVSILGPGTYCIEITNPLNGCTKIDCEEVTAISPIEISLTSVDASCTTSNDGSIAVDVDGGTLPYVYEWSNGETTAEINNLAPGTYDVTVTDANDCFDYGTVEIGVLSNSTIIADGGADQFFDCQTTIMVLDAGNSVFPQGADIEWTTVDGEIIDDGNSLYPTIGSPGTYVITIADQFGCNASDEVIVFETTANAGAGQTIDCNSSETQLDGSQSQNGLTYLWTTQDGNIVSGGATLNPTVNEVGTYTLTVTSPNGCVALDSVEVIGDFAEPVVIADDVSQTSCIDSVDLVASSPTPGTTFEWFDDQGQSLGMNPQALEPADFTVIGIAPNGCISANSVSVIDDRTSPVGDFADVQFLNCFNGNPLLLDFEISNPTNVTVAWNTTNGNIVGTQGVSILVDQAGDYEVIMTETDGGCTASASIEVMEDGVTITTSSTHTSCGVPDGTASVSTTGMNDPIFEWSNGETTPNVTGLAPGIYMVTISSAIGTCEEVRTFEILQDPNCLAVISGYVYNDDVTLDCDSAGDVFGEAGVSVHLLPDDVYTTTDDDGYYEFLVPAGDYIVEALPVSPYVVNCPGDQIPVEILPGDPESTDNNFFLDVLSNFDLYGNGNSSSAAPGAFQFYQLTYCNNGFQTIDGTLVFIHDPMLTDFDPDVAGATSYDPLTFTITWDFEELSFFECDIINFKLFVPEDIPAGTILKSKMIVQPILGDISPNNNTYMWDKTVHDPSPNSILDGEEHETENVEATAFSTDNESLKLLQNQPNPFKDYTIIPFYLNESGAAQLLILDTNGKLIKRYAGFEKGYNEVEVVAEELGGNGIYYYQLITENSAKTGKMVLIR